MIKVETRLAIESEMIQSQFIAHQEEINRQVEEGVKEAFKQIDFKELAKKQALQIIQNSISRETKRRFVNKFEGIFEKFCRQEMTKIIDGMNIEPD